ncbi:MAG: hypothetical protein BAA02_01965 [Paenibacillaceae bacterium ZCTH02-B3]|nr:MAG: hypothetical protein BAA02_01965 [Paenibacillaceae bacterium ZCTH02-B3]
MRVPRRRRGPETDAAGCAAGCAAGRVGRFGEPSAGGFFGTRGGRFLLFYGKFMSRYWSLKILDS